MTATIDEALDLFEGTGPEFRGGLSNHGPMASEALFALGRPDAAVPWAEEYKKRLLDQPSASDPIAPDEWRESLGRYERTGDWIAFFQREFAESPWQDVVRLWSPRLAPGMVGAALHGIIRAAHAVRSMGQSETALRRGELAQGFAYWAARYYELPSAPAANGALMPSSAVRQIGLMPEEKRANFGFISQALAGLNDEPDFPSVINAVDACVDASAFLSDLTRTFAGVLRSNADDFGTTIAFVHSVTGPSAVRLLLPHVDDADVPELLRHGWQAAAALYAAYGANAADESEREPGDFDDLIDRAVATGDEHAIKFTEACLREHTVDPQPVFLAAAQHTTSMLYRRN
jgi:Questin oxidase-like